MSRRTLSGAVMLSVSALALALVSPASAGHHHHGGKTLTCHGPASLSGYFDLGKGRKMIAKRADCATAKRVVKKFSKRCFGAYASQGKCKIRASGSWRCRSRVVGSLKDGAPSKESCEHRRSRLKFTVAYFPPTEPTRFTSSRPLRASGPWDPNPGCVKTSPAGTRIPPESPGVGNFEIHVLAGVPVAVGEQLQDSLVAHRVSPILHDGLGSEPRNSPPRIPIFLTPGSFDSGNNLGVKAVQCDDGTRDALIVRTNLDPNERERTAAHELFHAYSGGLNPTHTHPWWEEASATWAEWRTGYGEEPMYDINLQYPNNAIDATDPKTYPYAMSRFVQYLDDRGLIGDPAWPLERQVILGYDLPNATFSLFQEIPKHDSSTSLGAEAAGFWGDRLKAKPLHGKQLVPVDANSNQIEIDPGVSEIPATAERLHTKLFDFTISKKVERVTFEFDPPDDGYFWGLVKPNESERFRKGDEATFCVGGGDPDALKWPGHFPVTFTNGSLSSGSIEGKITVRASKDAGQCQLPTPDNRACQLLRDAKVNDLLGAGTFPFDRQDQDSESKTWICFYTGNSGEVDLNLIRALKLTAKQVRENAKKQIEKLGLDRVKNVGDIAGIGTDTANGKTYNIVVFAVAKEVALFTLSRADRDKSITLAKRLAGQLD